VLLNKFKQCGTLLVGLVWIPEERTDELLGVQILTEGGSRVEMQISARIPDKELVTPTYNKSTEFSDPNQLIVDTYGIPAYKEANPAVFTGVTFPFLFGVMFGDLLSGSLLLGTMVCIFALGKKTVGATVWGVRWMFLLMGIFAVFCGWIYNDFTSLPIYTFKSCYTYYPDTAAPTAHPGCVYPAGVDPAWFLSTSELTYANSLKMKISVIFGVAQMTIGIILKGTNTIYFRRWVDFFFEFLPQILTLWCLFGYMDYLIIVKWLTDWGNQTWGAPSVISIMIDMFLSGGVPSSPAELPILSTAEV